MRKRPSRENIAGWRLSGGKLLLITPHGEEEFEITRIAFTEVSFRYRYTTYTFELGDRYTVQKQPLTEPFLHYTVYRVLRRLASNIMQSLFRGARRPLQRVGVFIRISGYKVLLYATRRGLLIAKFEHGYYIMNRDADIAYTQIRPPYARLPEALAQQLKLLGELVWEKMEQDEIDPADAARIAARIDQARRRPVRFNRELRDRLQGNLFGRSLATSRNPRHQVLHAARRHRKR